MCYREIVVNEVQWDQQVDLDLMDPQVIKDHQVLLVHVAHKESVVVLEQLDQLVEMEVMVTEVPLDLMEMMVYLYVRCVVYL